MSSPDRRLYIGTIVASALCTTDPEFLGFLRRTLAANGRGQLKVVTNRLRSGYRQRGLDRVFGAPGPQARQEYLAVTTIVDDPQYLQQTLGQNVRIQEAA